MVAEGTIFAHLTLSRNKSNSTCSPLLIFSFKYRINGDLSYWPPHLSASFVTSIMSRRMVNDEKIREQTRLRVKRHRNKDECNAPVTEMKHDSSSSSSSSCTKVHNKNLSSSSNDDFDVFWKAYPKKKSKPDALKAWKKIKEPKTTLALILSALECQKKSENWTKENGQFIPFPQKYLNQRRWEDEPDGNTRNDSRDANAFYRAIREEDERLANRRMGRSPEKVQGPRHNQGGPEGDGGMPEDASSD